MKSYVDSDEEFTSSMEARLPIPEIPTPILCDNCSSTLTNFDSYYNKCSNCGVRLSQPTKNSVSKFLSLLPYTTIKEYFDNLPLPLR